MEARTDLMERKHRMECKKGENKEKCTCPNDTCPRHSICCECVEYHRSGGNLPMCFRNAGIKG